MPATKCTVCNGQGYYLAHKDSLIKTKCSNCEGSGWVYTKPEPRKYQRRNMENGKIIDEKKSNEVTDKKVTKKDDISFLSEYNKKWNKVILGKDKVFYHNGYVIISEKLINPKNLGKIQDLTQDKTNTAVMWFGRLLKDTGFRTLQSVVKSLGTVKGVSYRINQEMTAKPSISIGLSLIPTIIIETGIKLSKYVYIDNRYKQIFSNHRFAYKNPLCFGKGIEMDKALSGFNNEWYPVLCVNNLTGEIDGAIMPIGL